MIRIVQLSVLLSALLVPHHVPAQKQTADREWKPFFSAFRIAVKKRDRDALMSMMSRDFYYLSSGGDENGNEDTRDEAFAYWENTGIGAWEALEKVLAQGTTTNKALRDPDRTWPSRIAPPQANNRRAIANRSFPWYAIFEFRDGRWYCVAFTECCD